MNREIKLKTEGQINTDNPPKIMKKEIEQIIKNNIEPKVSDCDHSVMLNLDKTSDQILFLLSQARQEIIEEIREKFVQTAIEGENDPVTLRGLCLYNNFLNYLKGKR